MLVRKNLRGKYKYWDDKKDDKDILLKMMYL